MRNFRAATAILGGSLLALVAAATVLAYSGQVAATVQVSSPAGPQACNTPITVTALIKDAAGSPISDQPVAWAFTSGNVTGDKVLVTPTTTNTSGIATTHIQLACSPHTLVLAATADESVGNTTIVASGKALPRTDTAPASTLPTMLLAGLAVVAGMGLMLRRLAADRR
ncbi:MAG: Ig-like domain-containing protein [Candidatus Limnocylindrales bacterium]